MTATQIAFNTPGMAKPTLHRKKRRQASRESRKNANAAWANPLILLASLRGHVSNYVCGSGATD